MMLGKIFGSKEIIDNGLNLIDSFVYTDQEKTENKIKLLEAYTPFRVAQRILALIFTILLMLFVLLYVSFLLSSFDTQAGQLLQAVNAFNLHWIWLSIYSFYFGGGLIDSVRNKK